MRLGVKARETRDRSSVCSGGSMKIIEPEEDMSRPMISSTVPWLEMKVEGSFDAASTSA